MVEHFCWHQLIPCILLAAYFAKNDIILCHFALYMSFSVNVAYFDKLQ